MLKVSVRRLRFPCFFGLRYLTDILLQSIQFLRVFLGGEVVGVFLGGGAYVLCLSNNVGTSYNKIFLQDKVPTLS